jgi:hypothetical protein
MSRFTLITDKALQLVEQAGANMKYVVPSAGKLMQTGVALGAAKTGGRVAMAFVRRNPVIAVTAALGMGVLAYAASRKRKQEEAANPIEGRSKRVEARRVSGGARRSGGTATRKPRASRGASATTTPADE